MLPDAAQQVRGLDAKSDRELDDGPEPRVSPGALKQADLGPMEVTEGPELFLGQPAPQSFRAEVGGEALAR